MYGAIFCAHACVNAIGEMGGVAVYIVRIIEKHYLCSGLTGSW